MSEEIPDVPKRETFGVKFDGVGVPEPMGVHSPFDTRLNGESAKAVPDVVRLERLAWFRHWTEQWPSSCLAHRKPCLKR